MKKIIHIFLIVGLAANFLFAQNNEGKEVRRKITALGRQIEQIRVLAVRYQNQQALSIINDAQTELGQVIALLQEWETDRRLVGKLLEARAKFKSAEKKADYATRLILFKPAVNLENKLENLIRLAEKAVAIHNSNELYYFLNKARAFQHKALQAFSKDRYLVGHEYLKISTYFAEKTIELAKSRGDGKKSLANFEDQKNNIQLLLNRTSNTSGDPLINNLSSSIQEYLRKADNAYSQGNLQKAFSQLQIAERLLYRIIDLSETDDVSEGQQIEQNFQSLGRYLSSIRNEFENNNQQSKLLDKAEQFYRKAEKNINNQQYDQARNNLALSQRLAIKAFRTLSSGQDSNYQSRLENRLGEVNRLINLQQSRLEEIQNESLVFLHNQAKNYYQQAIKAHENNDPVRASFLLNVCLRLLNRVETQLKSESNTQISAETIKNDLDRVGNFIIRLQENTSLNDTNRFKLSILEEMYRDAQNEFEKNNLKTVNEILFIIQNQLSNLRNN